MSTYNFGKGNKFGSNNNFTDMGTNTKKLNKEEPKKLVPPNLNFSGEDLALIYKALRKLPVEESEALLVRMNQYANEMQEYQKSLQNGTKGK